MSAAEPIIRVDHISRSFGKLLAVDDLSFSVMPNAVVGFIGANGAGKTTTMRMMVTLDYPDRGVIEIGGLNVQANPMEIRRMIGWMPDNFGTYDHMDVIDYLDFFARAYRLRGALRRERIRDVLDFTGLDRLVERQCETLSKGEQQRLSLARTLMGDPQVLVLDEPAAGLDPKARLEFKNLVRLLKERGKTLFISSHILSELSEMCDSLLFIDGGRLKYFGEADKLTDGDHATGVVVKVLLRGDPIRLHQWAELQHNLAIRQSLPDGARLNIVLEDPAKLEVHLAQLLRAMLERGLEVFEFHREPRKLEDAFVEMLRQPGDN